MKSQTRAVHAGLHAADPNFGSVAPPIYPSSTFTFPNAAEGARRFAGESDGMIYSRLTNPTVRALEERVATVEGAEMCVATSSGMAAVMMTLLHLLRAGDHILAHNCLYGGSYDLIHRVLKRYGVGADLVDFRDSKVVEKHVRPNTKVLFFETPTNPMLELIDMSAVAAIAKKHQIMSVVDATFGPAALQNPFRHGIDIVIHSLTKYMGGHSDVIAGAILGSERIIKPMFQDLYAVYGATLSPFTAYLVMRGIATLGIRMERINRNAQKVAEYLEGHAKVDKVFYPGLKSHDQHELACRQMPGGSGGVMSFVVKGGYAAAEKLVNSIELFSLAVSLGGVESLIEHPASMTHSKFSEKDLRKAGIIPGLIRISVGIEDVEDQIEALEQGLRQL